MLEWGRGSEGAQGDAEGGTEGPQGPGRQHGQLLQVGVEGLLRQEAVSSDAFNTFKTLKKN